MTNKRITIVFWDEGAQGSTQIGGGQRLLFSIAERLNPDKFRPILLTSTNGELAEFARNKNIEVAIVPLVNDIDRKSRYTFGKNLFKSITFFSQARRMGRYVAHFCEINKVHILHPNENLTRSITALSSKNFIQTKISTHVDNLYTNKAVDRVLRKLIGRFDLKIAVSDAVGLKIPDTTTIYPGIDLKQFVTISRSSTDAIRFSIIAKLIEFKGQRLLLEAIASLEKSYKKKIKLSIVGSGPDELTLRNYANKLQLNELVTFHGQIDHIHDIYSTTDVVIQASSTEAFPLTLVEAGAAGIPTIATNAGGTSEIVIHNTTGVIIPKNNVSALAHAMRRMIDNPDNTVQLGKTAREVVQTNFDIESCIQHHEAAYTKLIQN